VRKHRKLLILLAYLAVIAVVVGTVIFASRDRQPHYQGKSLSEWLDTDDPADSEVRAAMNAIGTNAIPFLLKRLRHERGTLLKEVYSRLPRSISRHADSLLSRNFDNLVVVNNGFFLLGTNAALALPELTTMIQDTNDSRLARRAMPIFGYLGPRALPTVLGALSDTNFPNRDVIPLTLYLMCKSFGTNHALPPLLAVLHDPDPSMQEGAATALRYIAPELLTNAPAK
jgi:hypothetical protein